MAAVLRWSLRLFAITAMVFFAALMVVFIVVTVDQFGEKQYVTDSVAGLPPVYVLTAILVPFCAAFVAGFWMLFYDSFKARSPGQDGGLPVGLTEPEKASWRDRIRAWGREHRPNQPGWAHKPGWLHRPGWVHKPGWAHWPRRAD